MVIIIVTPAERSLQRSSGAIQKYQKRLQNGYDIADVDYEQWKKENAFLTSQSPEYLYLMLYETPLQLPFIPIPNKGEGLRNWQPQVDLQNAQVGIVWRYIPANLQQTPSAVKMQ